MKGICKDNGPSINLEQGKEYFLFPHGSTHFYVSKFDNPGAFFGIYEQRFFEIIEDDGLLHNPVISVENTIENIEQLSFFN